MKKCIKCGKDIEDNFNVCPYCGKKQEAMKTSDLVYLISSVATLISSVVAFCLYFFFKVGIGLIIGIPASIIALVSVVLAYKNKSLLISNLTIFILDLIMLITYFMF